MLLFNPILLKALVKRRLWVVPSSQVVYSGNPIVIKSGGSISFKWYFGREAFPFTINGHVFIRHATPNDAGFYYCNSSIYRTGIRVEVTVASKAQTIYTFHNPKFYRLMQAVLS